MAHTPSPLNLPVLQVDVVGCLRVAVNFWQKYNTNGLDLATASPSPFPMSVSCKQRGGRPLANHVIPVNKKLSNWDGSLRALHWQASRRASVCFRSRTLKSYFPILRCFLLSWACNAVAACLLAHLNHVAVGFHHCAKSWPECLRWFAVFVSRLLCRLCKPSLVWGLQLRSLPRLMRWYVQYNYKSL